MATPLALHAYRSAMRALEPLAPALLRRRARRGKENLLRIGERLGHASRPRPDGTLVWVHGASVGECVAALPLIDALLAEPGRNVLVTSGTVTSAEMMQARLPARALHQFAPVDTPSAVKRFFDHWHPDAGLFVDSEIWPNMLLAAKAHRVPLAIVNGRMSEKSFANWQKSRAMAAALLSLYDICLVQDDATAQRLTALGARRVEIAGSLKADAGDLPAGAAALEALQSAVEGRPVLVATNTHAGEDEIVLAAHARLRHDFPSLLTIIAPRHAERGPDIAQLCGARRHARRALGEMPGRDTEVYIADTMGELGLFYRLAPFAFVGKSLGAEGGQNPLEPARLGVAVIAGPYTDNFRDAYAAIHAAQQLPPVASVDELVARAAAYLHNPELARESGAAGARAVHTLSGALEKTRTRVEELLQAHART